MNRSSFHLYILIFISNLRMGKNLPVYDVLSLVATFLSLSCRLSLATAAELEKSSTNSLGNENFYNCGPNALYMFMIASGHPAVSFEELKAEIPLSSSWGSSLVALRNAAKKLGVDTAMRRYLPQQIDSVPLPAIVHISQSDVPERVPNHFDLMYKVDADWVYLVHGITAETHRVRRSKFPTWWTGYALIETESLLIRLLNRWWPGLAACLLIVDVAVFVIWFRKLKRCPAGKAMSEWEVPA